MLASHYVDIQGSSLLSLGSLNDDNYINGPIDPIRLAQYEKQKELTSTVRYVYDMTAAYQSDFNDDDSYEDIRQVIDIHNER